MSDAVDEVETEAGPKELLIATCECVDAPETATDAGQDNCSSILHFFVVGISDSPFVAELRMSDVAFL